MPKETLIELRKSFPERKVPNIQMLCKTGRNKGMLYDEGKSSYSDKLNNSENIGGTMVRVFLLVMNSKYDNVNCMTL